VKHPIFKRLVFTAILGLNALVVVAPAQAENALAHFRAYPLASRGFGLVNQQRYAEATTLFVRAVELMPSNIDYRLQLVNLLTYQGELQRAHGVALEGLKRAPNHQGLILLEDGLRKQLKAAQLEAEQSIAQVTSSSVSVTPQRTTPEQQALVETTLERKLPPKAAEADFCATVGVLPTAQVSGVVALNAGYCLLDAEKPKQAIALFEKAAESSATKTAVQALNQLGFMYADKGQHKKAADVWQKSIQKEANDEIHAYLARALRLSGQLDAAQQALMAAKAKPFLSQETRLILLEEAATLYDQQENFADAYHAGKELLMHLPTADNYYYQALRAQKLGYDAEAVNHLEQANTKQPENYEYINALAYAYLKEKQYQQANATFVQALALKESQAVRKDYAYTLKEVGERTLAAEQFVALQSGTDDREELARMRREVQELDSEWTTFGSVSYRDGVFSGIDSTGSQSFNDNLQYGIETVYSPEKWQQHGRRLQLYGQVFASSESGKVNYDEDSTQGVLGVRAAPLRDVEWYVYAARLISLGDNALDDTQLRSSYSYTDGFDYNQLEDEWAYTFLGVDGSYLFKENQLFGTTEARYGRSYKVHPKWVITPHAVAAGTLLDTRTRDSQNLEAGLGVSIKAWLGQTQTKAPDKSAEFIFQWREPISSDDNKSGPFVRLVVQF